MTLPAAVARAFYGQRASLREAQERAIDPLMAGHDVLVVAGTGSGKTEAVVAPLVGRHLEAALDASGAVFLYISPTKALANDMAARLQQPLESLHITVGRRHGDRNDLDRRTQPQFLITTPESLDNLLVRRHRTLLTVAAVIVDELHQLAGTQRGLQLCVLIDRLERWLDKTVQVAGMSATLARPHEAWSSVRPRNLCEVVHVPSDRRRSFVLRREPTAAAEIALLGKTSSRGKVLSFAQSRAEAETVAARLRTSGAFGERVYVHHSSLDKAVREQVERDLKGRDATLCVATSTLELGIDIGDINLVVLMGAPFDWRSFEQRIGRTNRREDHTNVLGLISPTAELPVLECAYFLGLIGQVEGTFPRSEARGQLYGALAQQVASLLRASGDYVPVRDVVDVLSAAPGTTRQDAEAIIDALIQAEYIRRHPVRNRIGADHMLHVAEQNGQAWGNFPANSQSLQLYHGTTRLGEVPALPKNLLLLQPGNTFAFRGRPWLVERLIRGREVRLRPSNRPADGQLKFGGTRPARDPLLVSQLPAVLTWSDANTYLATSVAGWWAQAASHCASALTDDAVPYWRSAAGYGHTTFAGLWINRVLAGLFGGDANRATEVNAYVDRQILLNELPDFADTIALAAEQAPARSGLTPWQQLLPPELAMKELTTAWTMDPYYKATWEQLRSKQQRAIHDDRLSALG